MSEIVEEWRPVVGYEGIYEVSSIGRVRRIKAYRSTTVGRILIPYSNQGYPALQLYKDGKRTAYPVHRLVAQAFIPKPIGRDIINHKDGIKTNCTIENLEWVTPSENSAHAYNTGLLKPASNLIPAQKGEGHHLAKLTETQVREIRQMTQRKEMSLTAIGRKFGVTVQNVHRIKTGKTWNHLQD